MTASVHNQELISLVQILQKISLLLIRYVLREDKIPANLLTCCRTSEHGARMLYQKIYRQIYRLCSMYRWSWWECLKDQTAEGRKKWWEWTEKDWEAPRLGLYMRADQTSFKLPATLYSGWDIVRPGCQKIRSCTCISTCKQNWDPHWTVVSRETAGFLRNGAESKDGRPSLMKSSSTSVNSRSPFWWWVLRIGIFNYSLPTRT